MGSYIIFHHNILDGARINELGPRSLPGLDKHGGELMAASHVTPLEGSLSRTGWFINFLSGKQPCPTKSLEKLRHCPDSGVKSLKALPFTSLNSDTNKY